MKAEYREETGCLQRDSAEHERYAGAQSIDSQEVGEQGGADLLEEILNRAYASKDQQRRTRNRRHER